MTSSLWHRRRRQWPPLLGGGRVRPGREARAASCLRVEMLEGRCLLSAFALDPIFGVGGTLIGELRGYDARDVAVQPDGKILVVGTHYVAENHDYRPAGFAVGRYNPDGTPDPTFGSGGHVADDFGLRANGVALQPDGKIIVGGLGVPPASQYSRTFALARYNPDGSPDTSFGSDGKAFLPLSGDVQPNEGAEAIAVQPDGKIVAVGSFGSVFVVVRFGAGGQPDPAFGTGGFVTTDFGIVFERATGVALQSDGKIVVAGGGKTEHVGFALLARYDAAGRIDPSFGAGGTIRVDDGFVGVAGAITTTLALQPDGKAVLVAANPVGANPDLVLSRFNADGSPDGGFGTGGRVVTPVAAVAAEGDFTTVTDAAVTADGRILVAGYLGSTYGDLLVVRYDAAGRLDPLFRRSGAIRLHLGASETVASALAVQPDGKVLLVGSSYPAPGLPPQLAMVRLAPTVGADALPGERFLAEVYLDVLGRPLDASGRATWGAALASGGTYTQVVAGILDSTEYRTGVIAEVYQRFLHRAPDEVGLTAGLAHIAGGGTTEQLEAVVAGSPEYSTRGGATSSNAEFLGTLYWDALGRDIDAAGRAFFTQQLDQTVSRTRVAEQVIASAESRLKLMDGVCQRFLGQPADPDELNAALQGGPRDEQLIPGLLASAKYATPILASPAHAAFVTQVYRDLLRRGPDAFGLAVFTAALDSGGSTPFWVVAAIQGSAEYRNLVVQDAYAAVLRRAADLAGLAAWGGALAWGATAADVRAALFGSAEYLAGRGGGTAAGFLAALYQDALNRTIDASGQAAFTQALAGGASRADVAATIFSSTEYRQDLVQSDYARFLHRTADPSGLDHWVTALQMGARDEVVVAGVVSSDEYFSRA
jgi:uncharacterized delta-60 repeat protein